MSLSRFRTLGLGTACALLTLTSVALAEDMEFTLTNATSSDLVQFYVSHSGTKNWEENLLAGARLPKGNEVQVLIADGMRTCNYDIRGVFADGSAVEDYSLNICDLGGYTFHE